MAGNLLAKRVGLNLVYGGRDIVVGDQIREAVGLEVADAYRADFALRAKLLHSAPRPVYITKGLVYEIQVQIVEPEAVERLSERRLRFLVAGVLNPKLGGDKKLIAGNAASGDRPADRFLVHIGGRRVYRAIAYFERVGNRALARFRILYPVDPEPQNGHFDPVVKPDSFLFAFHSNIVAFYLLKRTNRIFFKYYR